MEQVQDYQYLNLGSTIRAKSATDTLQYLNCFLDEYEITRVAHLTRLDELDIPVSACYRPNAKHLSVSLGKGITQELSDISAIMEGIEAYHMENPPQSEISGSYADLHTHFPLLQIEHINTSIYIHTKLLEAHFQWTPAHNLLTSTTCYVPVNLASINSTTLRKDFIFLSISTNGIAAGNTYEEALLHALYELIERDALSQWQKIPYIEKRQSEIAVATISNIHIKSLINKINDNHLILKIWDITSNIKIPSFQCAIINPHATYGMNVFTGSGSHHDCDIAILRAILEAVQARVAYISGARDDIPRDYYLSQPVFPENQSKQATKHYDQCQRSDYKNSFKDNITNLLTLMEAQGYKQIVELRHRSKIPVVQAFIPGLKFSGRRM